MKTLTKIIETFGAKHCFVNVNNLDNQLSISRINEDVCPLECEDARNGFFKMNESNINRLMLFSKESEITFSVRVDEEGLRFGKIWNLDKLDKESSEKIERALRKELPSSGNEDWVLFDMFNINIGLNYSIIEKDDEDKPRVEIRISVDSDSDEIDQKGFDLIENGSSKYMAFTDNNVNLIQTMCKKLGYKLFELKTSALNQNQDYISYFILI